MSGRHSSKNFELSPSDIMRFKYAPITSVDVERSFSRFKNILRPNRRHLTFDNLKEIVIIQCNHFDNLIILIILIVIFFT